VRLHQRLLPGAWVLSGVITLASIAAWTTAVPRLPAQPANAPAGAAPAVVLDTSGVAAATARLRDRNPFRVDRKPASVRFTPWESAPPSSPPPKPAPIRPPLAVVGIVGGPPWSAVVEGIPGRETGVLLTVGEEANGIHLTEIRGDTVRLAGFDTTWALTPRRPWR
jgi:hypothetical protein